MTAKRIITLLAIALTFCWLLNACGKSEKNDDAILQDIIVEDFGEKAELYRLESPNITITQRQTDRHQKNDRVWCRLTASNEDVDYWADYQLLYVLYNDGWKLESCNQSNYDYTIKTTPSQSLADNKIASETQGEVVFSDIYPHTTAGESEYHFCYEETDTSNNYFSVKYYTDVTCSFDLHNGWQAIELNRQANGIELNEKAFSSIAENDYPVVIQTLRTALNELRDDIELNALLEKYSGKYRDAILTKADSAFESEGYKVAIDIAKQGLVVLTNDEAILKAIEKYETFAPTYISKLKVLGSKGTYVNEDPLLWTDSISPYEDAFGNIYQEALNACIGYSTANGSLKEHEFIELFTGSEYSLFSGTLAPYYFKYAPNNVIRVNIYGDGTLLRSFDITSNTLPIEFNINIKNVDVLKIAFAPKSTHTWESCCVIFGNPTVTR